jgi:hypothetical protein
VSGQTGTITSGKIAVKNLEPVASNGGERAALGALAAAEPNPNATLQAIAVAFPSPDGWKAEAVVPFSSARRWSGADFGDRGTWVLGAPETILEHSFQGRSLTSRVEEHAVAGRRVVILSRTSERLRDDNELPDGLEVAGLVILEDEVRPEAGTSKPDLTLHTVEPGVSREIAGAGFLPLAVPHGSMTVLGFRVGELGYVTDAKRLPPETLEALRGVDVLVLNALWWGNPHPTHFNVEEAVETAAAVGARRTYLTHLTHRIVHRELEERLPEGVAPAYDGLTVTVGQGESST